MISVQPNDTTRYEADDVHAVEHSCVICKRAFFARPNAFIDKGQCEPCYVRLADALLKAICTCRCHA